MKNSLVISEGSPCTGRLRPSTQPPGTKTSVLRVTFAADAVARVSRATLKRMAQALGFNETQTVHYALAYFKRVLAQRGSGSAPAAVRTTTRRSLRRSSRPSAPTNRRGNPAE